MIAGLEARWGEGGQCLQRENEDNRPSQIPMRQHWLSLAMFPVATHKEPKRGGRLVQPQRCLSV